MKCPRCQSEKVRISYITVWGKYGYCVCQKCGFQFIDWIDKGDGHERNDKAAH